MSADVLGHLSIDTCGNCLALEMLAGETTGLSILITPQQWVAIVDEAEKMALVRQVRERRAQEAAREAASHGARASRK